MTLLSNDSIPVLFIQVNICFQIDKLCLEVEKYLGLFADIHYFQVKIRSIDADITPDEFTLNQSGLMRVGAVDGSLNQELKLREKLNNHKMTSQLLISTVEDVVLVNLLPELPLEDIPLDIENLDTQATHLQIDDLPLEEEYLEEEYLELEIPTTKSDSPSSLMIIVSYLPPAGKTLADWLKQEHSLESSLGLVSQVCHFFRFVYQQGWCVVQINPAFIQIDTPIKFFDLTGIALVGERLNYGLTGDYCAPELAFGEAVDEQMSTYIVGSLLYQAIHQQLPNLEHLFTLEIKPIPRIYQIIKICLTASGDRFPLSQLLNLLIEAKHESTKQEISWNIAAKSTVGLAINRLQNEDNYGVRQNYAYQSETWIIGVVADGMGGMAQGEIASKLAVKTVLEYPLPDNFKNVSDRTHWLTKLIQTANESVVQNVPNGGTTLSLVFAVDRELMIAHVGDSRIFLLRNDCVCQLSEDHSLVAMLFANGEINYEEIHDHPERSVLLRSIGTKRKLNNDYIQDLSRFGSGLSLLLEHGDTLILCSDGIWDLLTMDELAEVFITNHNLQNAVEETIDKVITRGANDNATILALQCSIQ